MINLYPKEIELHPFSTVNAVSSIRNVPCFRDLFSKSYSYAIHNRTLITHTTELTCHTQQNSSGSCNCYECSLRSSIQIINLLSKLFKIYVSIQV